MAAMKTKLLVSILFVSILGLLRAPSVVAGLDDIRRGAEQGDAQMQLELGELYEYGFGLPQNLVPALTWYILAAEQGNAQAAKRRERLQGRLTRAQVEEAERSAAGLRKQPVPAPVQTPAPGNSPSDTPNAGSGAEKDSAPTATPQSNN